MSQASYLFYDIETTGRNACFDQILQFAAIRTDLELNELERHELNIKLRPDVIPDPEALLIHQIPLADLLQGETEIAAVKTIYDLVNKPGTISGGYNTLSFDDEFLRFSFYRNLLPPYRHQFANNCGRFDLYPMTMLFFLFKNDCLNWPLIDGKTSLKLEQLNLSNNLAQGGMAHNALFDVEVTLALARKFFAHRSMWDYAQGYFIKNSDKQRFSKLPPAPHINLSSHALAVLVGKNASQDFYQSPALYLGEHRHYRNQQIWLRLDRAELLSSTHDSIAETSWAIRKKLGEHPLVLPYQAHYTQHLSEERLALVKENLSWLNNNLELFQKIKDYHLDYKYPLVKEADFASNLYNNGFLSDSEMELCLKFHQAPLRQKPLFLDKFTNPVLQEQGLRVLGVNYPELLTSEQKRQFDHYLQQVNAASDEQSLHDFRGNLSLTPKTALAKIADLRSNRSLETAQTQLLNDLEQYLLNF